jgi:hypothetical protein
MSISDADSALEYDAGVIEHIDTGPVVPLYGGIGELERGVVTDDDASDCIILYCSVAHGKGCAAPAENPISGSVLDGEPGESHSGGAVNDHHPIKLGITLAVCSARVVAPTVENGAASSVERDPSRRNGHPFPANAGDENGGSRASPLQGLLNCLAGVAIHPNRRSRTKQGGDVQHVSLEEAAVVSREPAAELVALDDALSTLAETDARKSQVVELKYFGGLSVEEAAEVLKVSPGTVMRDWSLAKAWLYRALKREAVDET